MPYLIREHQESTGNNNKRNKFIVAVRKRQEKRRKESNQFRHYVQLCLFAVIIMSIGRAIRQQLQLPNYQFGSRSFSNSLADVELSYGSLQGVTDMVKMVTTDDSTTTAGTDSPSSSSFLVTAVVIEVRCNPALSLVLLQAATFLGPKVKITVYHAARNAKFVHGLIHSHSSLLKLQGDGRLDLQLIVETHYGSTIQKPFPILFYYGNHWYSKMLTSERFWKSITTPYALTLQSDTLLCRPFDSGEFISRNESFTGGLSGFKRIYASPVTVTADPVVDQEVIYRHLNGGLSLRNVAWTVECIRQFGHTGPNEGPKKRGWIEDALYRECREAEIAGTVQINEVQAYSFASDNGKTLCFNMPNPHNNGELIRQCPLGVHKPWKEGPIKWGPESYQELVRYCPGLELHQYLCDNGIVKTSTCRAYDMAWNFTNFQCDCGAV